MIKCIGESEKELIFCVFDSENFEDEFTKDGEHPTRLEFVVDKENLQSSFNQGMQVVKEWLNTMGV